MIKILTLNLMCVLICICLTETANFILDASQENIILNNVSSRDTADEIPLRAGPCNYNPCKNNGDCIDIKDDYRCSCNSGYIGKNCQFEDPCSKFKSLCQNGGKCWPTEQGTYTCSCVQPFSGPKCEFCRCKNGNCVEINGKVECQCWPEYGKLSTSSCKECKCGKESNCTIVEEWWWHSDKITCICKEGYKVNNKNTCVGPCTDNPCKNDGICIDILNDYKCNCTLGYFGKKCEIQDPCVRWNNLCLNGGTCIPTAQGKYKCLCVHPFSGPKCEEFPTSVDLPNTTKTVTTTDLVSTLVIVTETTELSSPADLISTSTIATETTATSTISDAMSTPTKLSEITNTFTSTADFKETGVTDLFTTSRKLTTQSCYCGKNSLSCYFDTNGIKVCSCQSGYAQRKESCSETCRNDRSCLNGGICKFDGNGYFCICREHFKGDKCEIDEICEPLYQTCKTIGAVCVSIEWIGKGFCECPKRTFYNRELKICQDICNIDTCVHGKCEVNEYYPECRCDEGFEGRRCDQKISKKWGSHGYIIVTGILGVVICFLIGTLCVIINIRRLENKT